MKTNREVENVCESVINKYLARGNSHKILLDIIQQENIKFVEKDFSDEHFVGAFTTASNGSKYIFINKSINNIGRRNFTIAHELGHYFLKHLEKQNIFYCMSDEILEESIQTSQIEQEANYFATCLLMPEEKIAKAFQAMLRNSRKTSSIDFLYVNSQHTYATWRGICNDLIKRYGVSEAALRFRLITLNLVAFNFNNLGENL